MPSASQGKAQSGKSCATESDGASHGKLSENELKRKVNEMIRYILCNDRKMLGMKRPDLIKNVMKEHSKLYTTVMKEAAKNLSFIFGYELVEMLSEDGKNRGYILINKIDKTFEDDISSLLDCDKEKQKLGLLVIVLSLIFMNEGPIGEVSLWHTLGKFGLYKDKVHEVFGNLDKLLSTEFVKYNYLERQKVQGHEGPTYQYNWGPRSSVEISKRKILEFVSEVYGIDSIEDWKIPYQQVLDSETERMDVVAD